jgi:hypothetical protein
MTNRMVARHLTTAMALFLNMGKMDQWDSISKIEFHKHHFCDGFVSSPVDPKVKHRRWEAIEKRVIMSGLM